MPGIMADAAASPCSQLLAGFRSTLEAWAALLSGGADGTRPSWARAADGKPQSRLHTSA